MLGGPNWKLLPTLPVLLLLAGCYADQEQQLAACQLMYEVGPAATEVDDKQNTDNIELCMRAQGYEFIDPCSTHAERLPLPDPATYRTLSEQQKTLHNIEVGKMVIAVEALQRREPACYEPMSWMGKQVLQFERRFGAAQ